MTAICNGGWGCSASHCPLRAQRLPHKLIAQEPFGIQNTEAFYYPTAQAQTGIAV